MQKFRFALMKIKGSGHFGVTDHWIDLMAITIHCDKTSLVKHKYRERRLCLYLEQLQDLVGAEEAL